MLDFAFNSFNDLFKSRRLRVADDAKVPVEEEDDAVDLVEDVEGDEVTELLLCNVLFLIRTGDM